MTIDARDYQIFMTLADITNHLEYTEKIKKAEFKAVNPSYMEQMAHAHGWDEALLAVYDLRLQAFNIETPKRFGVEKKEGQ